jgi:hypothetical protein
VEKILQKTRHQFLLPSPYEEEEEVIQEGKVVMTTLTELKRVRVRARVNASTNLAMYRLFKILTLIKFTKYW